ARAAIRETCACPGDLRNGCSTARQGRYRSGDVCPARGDRRNTTRLPAEGAGAREMTTSRVSPSPRFPDRAAAARRRRMGRFITLAMCAVIVVGVAGCATKEQKAAKQQAKADAEAAKYPPPPAKSKMAQITDGMRESDVMKIMGPPDDSKAYVTG